jgi:hypothetical protein
MTSKSKENRFEKKECELHRVREMSVRGESVSRQWVSEWAACGVGGGSRYVPTARTNPIRRLRQVRKLSSRRDRWGWFFRGRCRLLLLWHIASARSKRYYSHPPDIIPTNRVRRLKRRPSSVISYKLMLHLKKLQKSAIKKNSLVSQPFVEVCGSRCSRT